MIEVRYLQFEHRLPNRQSSPLEILRFFLELVLRVVPEVQKCHRKTSEDLFLEFRKVFPVSAFVLLQWSFHSGFQ